MARYFEFIKDNEAHVFSGKQPRDAALKAATRFGKKGSVSVVIKLREHGRRNKDGSYSLHVFKVGYKQKKTPGDAPTWLGNKVKEPQAKKIRVERVNEIPKP